MHIFQENTASFHKSLHSLNDLCQRLWVHITSPVKNLPALPQIQNAYFLTYSLGANAVNIETEQNNTAVFFHNQQGNRAKGATALLQDRYTVVTMASVSCSEATGIHPVRASAAHRFQIFSVPSEMLFCKLLFASTSDLYVPTRSFLPEICHLSPPPYFWTLDL